MYLYSYDFILCAEVVMGVESISNGIELSPGLAEGLSDDMLESNHFLDSRRRLENKMEDLKLEKEMQDFDFDL